MRIVVLYNPRSGRGRAADAAAVFAGVLSGLGHATEVVEASGGLDLFKVAQGAGALVIAGGDGTLHHAVADLVGAITDGRATEIPGLYHLPLGTENLFARQFGMNADATRLHRLLESGRTRPIDAGVCNGRAFILMCGIGPDAGVLMRLNAAASENGKRRPITLRSYIGPMVAELLSLKTPSLTVSVDGCVVVNARAGLLIVGNSRQYAMRFDPAIGASMSDGLLDTVFFPARSRLTMLGWALVSRFRRHTKFKSLVYRTGTRIEVSTGGQPTAYQLDGEALVSPDGKLSIKVLPGALRVWAPD